MSIESNRNTVKKSFSLAEQGATITAHSFAVLAFICSFTALMGWIFPLPWLRGFGADRLPISPLTALGYATLAAGMSALFADRKRAAYALWSVPPLVALITIGLAALPGIPSDPNIMPGENSAVTFILLAMAAFASGRATWRQSETAGVVASAAISLAVVAVPLAFFASHALGQKGLFASSLPGSLSAITVSVAIVVWNIRLNWKDGQSETDPSWRLARSLLPLMLMLPTLPSLAEIMLSNLELLTPAARELAVVVGNIVIIAAFAIWALRRVGRDHERMAELNRTLDHASIAIVSSQGTIRHWPKGCEQFYGWTAKEALGRNKYALLQSRCQQHWAPGLPRYVGTDTQELVEVRKDGTEVSVIERVSRFANRNGEVLRVLSMLDVSRTVEAVDALRASEERLAVATAAHQLGVVDFNISTGTIEWSPGAETRLGLEPGSIRDFESWIALVHPEDSDRILTTLRQVMEDRAEHFNYRYRFLPPDGQPRSVEGSARAYFDADGTLTRAVGVVLDVTEREEGEAALRASEAQLRSIFDTVPDPMIVFDEHGRILRYSAAAETLWGYQADEVLGKHLSMLIPAAARGGDEDAGSEPFFLRAAPTFVDLTINTTARTAGGRLIPVEARTSATNLGDQTLFTVFYRDLTDQLANEERMSDLNAELAHVSRQSAMSELAADLAHELNQPLSASANFLAAARMLIENGGETERVSELLRMGTEQTQRAGQIIRRLREFLAKGEVEMRAEPLEPTLREAAELVLLGTGQFDIQMKYDIEPAARLVFVDRIQIQQVAVNLLRNSMEALRTSRNSSRSIEISARKISEHQVEVSVCDNGPGIPDALLTQLYARFTSTKDGSGMGIGLSISKRIIEAYGGTLSAENRAQGGAVFRFTLPTVGEVEEV
ncbi:PAS domain-containing sensor histidine kinase [Stakelama tenebrarum]|uniref:histidine kinase n=1 Tax=Stakelama tenebrarum TaxID=2711215 RepID=A0A6G6Y462_9SPHN|nr:PAS domain-containing sensor histidine kinase [Sphingosinithalassobacter tenebrarum]QIG79734.1 PAS domain S-box protein [Sphingosinithalassobacter tenebrarum]